MKILKAIYALQHGESKRERKAEGKWRYFSIMKKLNFIPFSAYFSHTFMYELHRTHSLHGKI